MAEFELSPAFEKVRRKLGNMIFYVSGGDVFARKRPGKRSGGTPAQVEIKNAFTKLSGDWKFLEGIIQESWNLAAKSKKRLHGYSAFVGANVNRQRKAEPLELSRSMGVMALASFAAASGSTAGAITCEFAKNAADADKFVTFFHQKKDNGVAGGEITRVECGTAASPFTLTGLEPGAEYHVYAVVTDKAYGEAEAVSMARNATVTAGA